MHYQVIECRVLGHHVQSGSLNPLSSRAELKGEKKFIVLVLI